MEIPIEIPLESYLDSTNLMRFIVRCDLHFTHRYTNIQYFIKLKNLKIYFFVDSWYCKFFGISKQLHIVEVVSDVY